MLKHVLPRRGQLIDGQDQEPRGPKGVDQQRRERSTASVRVLRIGGGFEEQRQDRLTGNRRIAVLAQETRHAGKGECGAGLAEEMVALQRGP